MLTKRNVRARLVLSVLPGDSATVSAHAWLEAGGIVVTGKSEMEKFIPIYQFDNQPARPQESVAPCSH
jgi:hypothetical protein